jgi:integrase
MVTSGYAGAGRCAWIHPEESKSGQGIAVPLDDNACAIIMSQLGKHQTYVFTYQGEPVTQANNRAWRNALKRAKIDDFRWHDLRHTWTSYHRMNGTPIDIIKDLGGWASYDMVFRYAHLSSDHLQSYAKNSFNGTNSTQSEKNNVVKIA